MEKPVSTQNASDRLTGRPSDVAATNLREGAPFLPEKKDESSTSKISPEEAEAIRQKAFEILRKEYPPPATPTEGVAEQPPSLPQPSKPEPEPQPIPARMLNEFVYCPRLFYYEFVEGVFVESADTLRGAAIHQRVDSR